MWGMWKNVRKDGEKIPDLQISGPKSYVFRITTLQTVNAGVS